MLDYPTAQTVELFDPAHEFNCPVNRVERLLDNRNAVQLPSHIRNRPRADIQHQAVTEDYPGVQASANHLDLRRGSVLEFIESAQPDGIERLDAAEKQLASGL